MNDRSGLLTLAAYITAAMLIALVALLGVFHYGAKARVAALPPVPAESSPELAAAGLELPSGSAAPSTNVSGLAQQRIRLLESMLSEKTEFVRQQAEQIAQQTKELNELRQRFDDAMLMAVESFQNAPAESPTEPTEESDDSAGDPERLEAELMLARVVHDALVSDVEALQEELDRAYGQMGQLRDDADLVATNQLRDVLALEAASAGIVLRVGRDAVPGLIDALAHTNPVVRRWAASVLGGMGQDAGDAIGALTEATSDTDPDVRRAAKAALDAIAR